jgi:glycine C-acetyltransferase
MNSGFRNRLSEQLGRMREAGTFKELQHIETPMDSRVTIAEKGPVTILSSNNYLGLANNPDVIDAGKRALDEYGAGTASVRFICGTFTIHRELEEKIATFMRTEAALSYVSCWNANTGAIPLLAGDGDALLSDELNHASIIDGVRMSKAKRYVYKHGDMQDLESKLREAADARTRIILTDGVFSMEGDLAPIPDIVDLANRYDAVTFVDDSHGTGVMGANGRGVVEHFGMDGEVDIITSTLGKALGGAAGGFVASTNEVVEMLIQASRPQIFSNALPTTIAASAKRAIEILEESPELVAKLQGNADYLRKNLRRIGFQPLESESGIIPIIVGQTSFAIQMSQRLLDHGIFVTGFGYPVVPEGTARVRVQSSAALDTDEMDRALEAFEAVGKELGLI